ncbi:MAG: NADH-quinone oxidoreductase subunit N [Deltaproteobacteria bacterium CG11_big_fil_rev_8_21_14_0_20_47_16]|nr:MAG: NADH-quinone oxidoreductase subunit N [Deltaproteobacteria bacterium CG11_big_fil_rev_8_21_14_0_20_47_16]
MESLLNTDWLALAYNELPLLLLIVGGTLVLLADLWWPQHILPRWARRKSATVDVHVPDRTPLLLFGMLAALVAFIACWRLWVQHEMPNQMGMLVIDRFSLVGGMMIIGSTIAGLALGWGYLFQHKLPIGEYTVLMLFATAGAWCMISSANLLLAFVGIEILSISAYVLAGMDTKNRLSVESGLKYFLLGAVASAFLLFGIAFFYGATGTLSLVGFTNDGIMQAPTSQFYLILGTAFFLVGIGFKVALAPFHTWTPDVYEGAPIPVTAWFASAVKAAAFLLFARVMLVVLPLMPALGTQLIAGLAIATMFIGNMAALWQDNIKRLLAYSSIAHAGYAALALVTMATIPEAGITSLLWYLMSYSVMTIGAFAVVQLLGRDGEELTSVGALAGLGERHPWLAACLSIFLLSLAGLPPTVGFMAKYYLLANLVAAGHWGLTIAAIISSLISVGYYSYPIVVMYFRPVANQTPHNSMNVGVPIRLVIFFAALAVLVAGIFPDRLMSFIQNSVLL